MNPYVLTIVLLGMGLGTAVTFMSSHWLLAWMGLEMNTLAIIPLMMQQHHPRAVEATTKYFLAQAAAAAMLLFASLTNAWLLGQWNILSLTHPMASTLVITALALKTGLAPLHAWLPEVLQGLDLTTGLILSTWQKLAPFALIVQIHSPPSALMIFLGLLSTLVGGWGGLNQTQLRKILAYSSIAHLGWMILVLQFNPALTLLALFTYILMTFSTFLVFEFNSATTISSLTFLWSKTPLLATLTPLILLSLGGLPPLTGFGPKWLILHEITKQQLPLAATFAALAALLSLYFYLRLSYALALTLSPNTTPGITPWRLPPGNLSLFFATSVAVVICALPLVPLAQTLTMV
uniref:NADH dehydrogenase subunit 2 n=1 Tax=Stathmonotus gymnodermis TaxID=942588 RepID=UPI0028D5A260|nr:NADH dehydrogenase subunit 2 [Stathmonotus gymnodermis]WMY90436.1 NADH dehydrogenase subunit 2 [Stathmonotus gymnodermis]